MITRQEFLVRTHLEVAVLDAWVEAGWIIPRQAEPEPIFSDVDLARAALIRDLRDDLGVNEEGIAVILDLVDQVHGLRRTLNGLLAEVHRLKDERRG